MHIRHLPEKDSGQNRFKIEEVDEIKVGGWRYLIIVNVFLFFFNFQ